MYQFVKKIIFAGCVIGLGYILCSCHKEEKPQSLLGYVPADTAYVFANQAHLPEAIYNEWRDRYRGVVQLYDDVFDDIIASVVGDDFSAHMIRAVIEEIKGNASVVGMEHTLGVNWKTRFAVYEVDLVPVFRIELVDPNAFRAFIERVQVRAQQKLPTHVIDGLTYWRLEDNNRLLAGAMAVIDNQLVVSLVPHSANIDMIRRAFGLVLPEQSMESSGRFDAFNQRMQFLPYGSGYLELKKLHAALLAGKSEMAELLRRLLKIPDQIPAHCLEETATIAQHMPQWSFGYKTLNLDSIDMRFVMQLQPELARQLAAIVAAVPGLGNNHPEDLMHLGFGLDMEKMAQFLNHQADLVSQHPFQCNALQAFDEGIVKAQQGINNPLVAASASLLQGMRMAITKFDAMEQPIVGEGYLILATKNPELLFSSVQTLLPQLQSVTLPTIGEFIQLPGDIFPFAQNIPPLFLARSEHALGLAAGEQQGQLLIGRLSADAENVINKPLVSVGYSGRVVSEAMKFSEDAMSDAAVTDKMELEKSKRAIRITREMYDHFKYLNADVFFTDQGIEIREVIQLQ